MELTMFESRRNHRVKRNFTRKTRDPRHIFGKVVHLIITGTDVDAINETASQIYALQNEYTSGGKSNRSVQIKRTDSSDVETLFYGRI